MPLSSPRIIRYEVLAAPPEHLGVLIEPPAATLRSLLASAADPSYERTAVLDTTLAALRTQLRQRLELTGPVILTGHQAEFIHAGVFAKTIAAHALARQCGGQAVFLTVDCDVPKTAQLAVPQLTAAGVRRIDVDIPGCDPRRPFESQAAAPRGHWREFFARVGSLHPFQDRALLRTFAEAWLATDEATPQYCAALARTGAASERELGLDGVRELRMSALCATPEFRAFAAHLLLDARRGAECYNAAQLGYRRRHRVRSAARPAPPLVCSADVVEAPLWIYRQDEPRRRLATAVRGETLELVADGAAIGQMPRSLLEHAAAHGAPSPLERDGWCLRPRALALSAFARLFLADLFIHGIGGAKYDEMMEDFVRGLFGVQPRPACCVTATLHLPLPHSDVRDADLVAARRQSRDLRFNPQRHLRRLPEELVGQRAGLVRRSVELRERQPREHGPRRLVFGEIRRVSEEMLRTDPWRPAEYDQRIETLLTRQRQDRVALDREYFYALHPRETLNELVQAVRRGLAAE